MWFFQKQKLFFFLPAAASPGSQTTFDCICCDSLGVLPCRLPLSLDVCMVTTFQGRGGSQCSNLSKSCYFSRQKGSFSLAVKMNWPESFREIWQQTGVSCEIWINKANATRGSGTTCHKSPWLHMTCLLEGMLTTFCYGELCFPGRFHPSLCSYCTSFFSCRRESLQYKWVCVVKGDTHALYLLQSIILKAFTKLCVTGKRNYVLNRLFCLPAHVCCSAWGRNKSFLHLHLPGSFICLWGNCLSQGISRHPEPAPTLGS